MSIFNHDDFITDMDMAGIGYFYEGTGGGCDAYIKRIPFTTKGSGSTDNSYDLEIIVTDGDLNCPSSFPCEAGAILYRFNEIDTVLDAETFLCWNDIEIFTDKMTDHSNIVISERVEK